MTKARYPGIRVIEHRERAIALELERYGIEPDCPADYPSPAAGHLLIQRNRQTSELEATTHHSRADALEYHNPELWRLACLVNLDARDADKPKPTKEHTA